MRRTAKRLGFVAQFSYGCANLGYRVTIFGIAGALGTTWKFNVAAFNLLICTQVPKEVHVIPKYLKFVSYAIVGFTFLSANASVFKSVYGTYTIKSCVNRSTGYVGDGKGGLNSEQKQYCQFNTLVIESSDFDGKHAGTNFTLTSGKTAANADHVYLACLMDGYFPSETQTYSEGVSQASLIENTFSVNPEVGDSKPFAISSVKTYAIYKVSGNKYKLLWKDNLIFGRSTSNVDVEMDLVKLK